MIQKSSKVLKEKTLKLFTQKNLIVYRWSWSSSSILEDDSLTLEAEYFKIKMIENLKYKSLSEEQINFSSFVINAGAGGTELVGPQCFFVCIFVLLSKNWTFNTRRAWEKAGIKSVTLEIQGTLVWALKAEIGVHRYIARLTLMQDVIQVLPLFL